MARKKKSASDPSPVDVEDQVSETVDVENVSADVDLVSDIETATTDEITIDAVDDTLSDTIEPDKTDDIAQADPLVTNTVSPKKSGFVPALLGGVACVVIGYGAANFIRPDGWPFPGTNTTELTTKVEALEAELTALRSDAQKLDGDLIGVRTSLEEQIKTQVGAIDLNSSIAPLADNLSSLEARLSTVEARPVQEAIVSPEATAAYERQLEQMRTLLNDEVSRLQTAQASAQADEMAATAATALASLKAAIDSGNPYADLLTGIEIEIPAAIEGASETGVAAISVLQDEFAPAAREALTSSARAAYDEGTQGWFETFTRTQLGLRSLDPKDGDSADAILSRAGAKVTDADFPAALSELENLPDAGRTAMADWIEKASARVAVTDALQSMFGQ